MITAVIGRTFLNAYNKKYGKTYTPRKFFDDVYWDLFFNESKFLMAVTNSPFDQGYKQKRHLSQEGRLQDYEEYHRKIDSGKSDASIFLGAPASDENEFASTSGLVSDVLIPVDKDEVYLSWIGAGLGVMVSGGFAILFDDPVITLQTFEGWKVYRRYLNDPSLEKLRANQVNSWNGQWLTYSMGKDYREHFDFLDLTDQGIFKVDTSVAEVQTVNWSRLFFSLSQRYPKTEMMGYVYGFGQTNKTIGFIPFQFKSGSKLKDVYRQLFGGVYSNPKEFESLFGMHIKRACELGTIGLQALRPDSLKKYMIDGKNLSFKREEDLINYQVYKTWLVAMLKRNKDEIIDYTSKLAEVILRYRNSGKGMARITLVEKEMFASKSKKGFIESLTQMIPDIESEDLESLKTLKDEVHLMTNEEFGYFLTLLKFDYSYRQEKF